MKRICLTVAYDGTAYRGFQIQKNGLTVEEVLNRELSSLLKEEIAVAGASRTDAGVHAKGNVVVFDTKTRIPAEKLCLAVNQSLPEDIRVLRSCEVDPSFHPRRANSVKTYEYRILNTRICLPQERLYSYCCYDPLDAGRMQAAADFLVGEHDFKSFCSPGSAARDTVRTIYELTVRRTGDVIVIRVSGSGFLYNMVRIIAGTLMKIGRGQFPPEHMREVLEARDRRLAGDTAPARGLTLIGIEYEKELPDLRESENTHWHYRVLLSRIKTEQTACFLVFRCESGEWERLVLRSVHHAFQDGARRVLVSDLEKDRFRAGDRYGHYKIVPLSAEEGQASPGGVPPFFCAAVDADGRFS